MRRFTSVISVLALNIIFLSTSIQAASTSIEGYVKDATSGESLFGANIMLVGTSMGAASDMNGKYLIQNVLPGTYKIRATYIGYRSQTMDITIKDGDQLKLNFKLEPVAVEGQTVVITAQASGQTQAINQQLSSDQIINVVSAAKIQELPDANAAESLGRLPGISVLRSGGEADQVVIRGLAPKFNQIMINGIQLTSSNPNDQSVDLSMISSNMLEGMEIKKTVTPDMDANVIGGVVNLELREAHVKTPGVPQFGLLAQGGYNALSNAYNKLNNYKYVVSGENRFFNDNFGIFAQFDVERKNLTSNQMGANYSNDGSQIPLYITNGLNLDNIPRDRQRYDGAVVFDYRLPEGTIKFSNFLSTGTTNVQDRGEYFGIAGSSGSNVHNYSLAYSSSTLSVITNALHLQYQLPIFHVNAIISHAYTETKDPHDWTVTFQQGSAGLGGLINQPNLNPLDIPKAANNDTSLTYLNSLTNTGSFSGARALAASLDLKANANLSDEITTVIKFGGMYRYQTRSYSYNTTGGQGLGLLSAKYVDNLIANHFPSTTKYNNTTNIPMMPFIDPSYSYGKFLGGSYPMVYPLNFAMLSELTNFLQKNAGLIAANDAVSYFNDQFGSTTYNYTGHENQSAAYVMTTINIGPQITLIPGIRYQNLQTIYTGTRGVENTASALGGPYNHYDTTVTVNHGFWLPDVALRYKPFSWFDMRLSYTNTLAYPDYNSIIPRIDATSGYIAWNNFQLVPSRSTNYDLNFSFYNNTIGLLTVGGFLKQIDNLIYPYAFYTSGANALKYFPPSLATIAPSGTYQVTTYVNNSNRATDYGLELDWQTHFWYLPHPFDGLVLDVNFTHVYSSEKYPFVNTEKVGRQIVYVDTSYSARLLYQPDNIANLSLGYDYQGFSIRISMIYQDNIFSGPNFWPQLRTNTSAYTRWDLSAKQDLPWYGLQVYGDLSNINGENDVQVIQAPTGVPQSQQDYGMTADLGIRIKL
ncbi:MAG: TonB-dependent receptor [Ignavibacteriaceae bacterium]